MKTEGSAFDKRMRNTGFCIFVCTTLGFVMLETCLIRLGARPVAHIISMVIGTTLAIVIHRGIVGYWSISTAGAPETGRTDNWSLFSTPHLISTVSLGSIGYIGAVILGSGTATASALYVSFLLLFPWTRMSLCWRSIPFSVGVIVLAAIAGLLMAGQQAHPLYLAPAVWMLWFAALGMRVRMLLLKMEKSRVPDGAPVVENTAAAPRN